MVVNRMKTFILMHKNNPVANVSIQKDEMGNGCLCVDSIINRKELPYGLKSISPEQMDISMTWWNNTRCIPLGRPNYDKILNSLGLSNAVELIPYSYMCSLTDNYWFKPSNSHVRWENVNFRDNGFDSNLYRCLFFGEDGTRINNLNSPDIPTDGAMPKMWVERDGEFYLVKKSTDVPPMEVYNEVLASAILEQLGIPHVEYTLENINGEDVSVCPCFIKSDDCEFVQFANLMSDGYYNSPDEYFETMAKFGFQNDMDSMIFVDMVIGNIDRHTRNYGQIIDSVTQRVMGPAPIFDNGGCTFLHDVSNRDYKPTELSFEETTKSLSCEVLAWAERIDLDSLGSLIDSFAISEQDKATMKNNLNSRVEHMIELSRGIEYDIDRDRR